MFVRLLLPVLTSFALCLPGTAGPIPALSQDSITVSGPIEDAFVAQYLLGSLYRYGSLGKADLQKATELFKASAKGKCVDAAVALSEIERVAYLEAPRGPAKTVAKRRVEASLFRAFVLGSERASAQLSELFAKSASDGQAEKAIAWAGIAKAARVAGAEATEARLLRTYPASATGAERLRTQIESNVKAARAKSRGVIQVQVPVEMFLPKGKPEGKPEGKPGREAVDPSVEAAFEAADAAFMAEDCEAALRGFQPLAEAGHPEACFCVARIKELGLAGPKDEAAAQRFYLRSAEGGIPNAMSNLGFM